MKAAENIATPELSANQLAALLKLLADEDPAIYQTVREKLLSYGPKVVELLRPHALSRDPAMRRRVQQIMLHFERQMADDCFLAFCLKNGEEFDLEQAAWLFAQTRYPEINVEAYQALLDSFATVVQEQLEPGANAKQLLATINNYLFCELGFAGNEESYYDPENSYLNRVIDRRTGNPINLCLFYILMARRLRLPITGIGMPGHFLCRYQSTAAEIYIDVFSHGKLLAKADCIQYLLKGNYSIRDDYLAPLSARRIMRRICNNLLQIKQSRGATEEATQLQRYCIALER